MNPKKTRMDSWVQDCLSSTPTSPLILMSILVSCVKFLLIPFYRSTDFEVHRNWLAITHNLPVDRWYFDETSQWTLDYPPLFAWFERILSFFASKILSSPELSLRISSSPVETKEILLFQRISVILADTVYLYAVYQWIRFISGSIEFTGKWYLFMMKTKVTDEEEVEEEVEEEDCLQSTWKDPRFMSTVLLVCSPGLLLVDHIHFQYNGFLLGFFLLSIVRMLEGRVVVSSVYFALLLHLKHIYVYAAPAFFIFILRNHCLDRHYNIRLRTFLLVSASVSLVSLVSLSPFFDQLPQLLSRLFPFKRGLTHSFWAPNVWSVYNFIDWILLKLWNLVLRRTNVATPVYVRGLVEEFDHEILPNIRPWMTFLLTLIGMMPSLKQLWNVCHFPSPVPPTVIFLRSLTLCTLSSFLFSWHVHEKAILMPLLPLTLLIVVGNRLDCKVFLILSVTAIVSLLPLLPDNLVMIKILFLVVYVVYAVPSVELLAKYFHENRGDHGDHSDQDDQDLLTSHERTYVFMFIPLLICTAIIHPFLWPNKLSFLPLAITSVYCSLGVIYSFLQLHCSNTSMQ